jgi:hypothetical protein
LVPSWIRHAKNPNHITRTAAFTSLSSLARTYDALRAAPTITGAIDAGSVCGRDDVAQTLSVDDFSFIVYYLALECVVGFEKVIHHILPFLFCFLLEYIQSNHKPLAKHSRCNKKGTEDPPGGGGGRKEKSTRRTLQHAITYSTAQKQMAEKCVCAGKIGENHSLSLLINSLDGQLEKQQTTCPRKCSCCRL